MKQLGKVLEPKHFFRNVYFWLAVGGAIFLFYVGFIAFTFLPRSSSEVIEADGSHKAVPTAEKTEAPVSQKRAVSSKTADEAPGWQVKLVTSGGWVDSDNRNMTIVMRVLGLSPATVEEIIRSGGIGIEIDGVAAEIINSEPYGKNGFLTRAKAGLSVEKFDDFSDGKTGSVEIKITLRQNGETVSKVLRERFAKQNKTEVEGVKIAWK